MQWRRDAGLLRLTDVKARVAGWEGKEEEDLVGTLVAALLSAFAAVALSTHSAAHVQ